MRLGFVNNFALTGLVAKVYKFNTDGEGIVSNQMLQNKFYIMNTRIMLFIWLAAASVAQRAQSQVSLNYDFTVNPGYTLDNIYIVDTVPSGFYASATPLAASFINGGTYPINFQGSITLGYAIGNQYLTMMAVFTDPNQNQGVAMSLPVSLAGSLVNSGATWAAFDTSTYFTGGPPLPDESHTEGDLVNGQPAILLNAFDYMPANDPILTAPINISNPAQSSTSGEIVAFDGAESLGSITVSVPEPSSLLLLGLGSSVIGVLMVIRRRMERNSDKTVA